MLGEEKGLVIDTGIGKPAADATGADPAICPDIMKLAKSVTDLPLILVNTHGHLDHMGNNMQFEKAYVHPLDRKMALRTSREVETVTEGDCFDLGKKLIEVIETPGHTPRGIVLLDREESLVFVGDMFSEGSPMFLQFEYSDLDIYIASTEKLLSMSEDIEWMFPCHGTSIPLPLSYAAKIKSVAEKIRDNNISGTPIRLFTEDGPCEAISYVCNGITIYH
ncbi:MAG: MBL fold metallo-hydrolase [Lachnospiraceae bacterium]|nr:MBL fold metallo-hydrolase [Lachnospiraceae bacterium]